MELKHKIAIGVAVVVIGPLIGGLIGYGSKECPEPDRALYDSLEAENLFLKDAATRAIFIADSLADARPEPVPAETIYKKHATRLSNSVSLDTLRGINLTPISPD